MKDIRDMTDSEYGAYLKQKERERTATVGDFIDYLKKTYSPDDKICFIDCVEGLKYDATPVYKEDLGVKLFRRIRDIKDEHQKQYPDENPDSFYPYVDDEDILII